MISQRKKNALLYPDIEANLHIRALHGCIMILAFVGLMPLGLLILRIMNSVKWHGLNQTLSVAVALIGTAAGIYAGSMYNRVSWLTVYLNTI